MLKNENYKISYKGEIGEINREWLELTTKLIFEGILDKYTLSRAVKYGMKVYRENIEEE